MRKPWVAHCQPVGAGQRALAYLAPYIFRVAITNRRIVSVNNTGGGGEPTVTFRYRLSGSRQWRLSTVTVMEFMSLFLQHVLPKGFVKVRYSCAELAEVTAFLALGNGAVTTDNGLAKAAGDIAARKTEKGGAKSGHNSASRATLSSLRLTIASGGRITAAAIIAGCIGSLATAIGAKGRIGWAGGKARGFQKLLQGDSPGLISR